MKRWNQNSLPAMNKMCNKKNVNIVNIKKRQKRDKITIFDDFTPFFRRVKKGPKWPKTTFFDI